MKYYTNNSQKKTFDLDIDSLEQDINLDFEENPLHQEGVISETYQRPDKSYFQTLPELQIQVDRGKPNLEIFEKVG